MTEKKTEAPAFEKEVIRLPDGRELTYYRFPEDATPQRSPDAGPSRPTPKKER